MILAIKYQFKYTYEDTSAAYGYLLAKQLCVHILGVSRAIVSLQPFIIGCLFKLLKHPI